MGSISVEKPPFGGFGRRQAKMTGVSDFINGRNEAIQNNKNIKL
jgi:hypothetical protein